MLPFFNLGPASAGLIPIICVILGSTPLSGLLDCPDHGPPRLEMSATVNQRPSGPLVRVGAPVVAAIRISDTGRGDAADVRLTQAGSLGGAIACPSGGDRIPSLSPGQSVVCLVRVTAAAGPHQATVTATGRPAEGDGDDDDDDKAVTASTTAGYRGVSGALAASESVTVGAGAVATMRYSVTNTGNLPLFDLSATDPVVPAGGIACPGTPSGLPPGATIACTAVVRLAPGDYRSSLTITGDDRTTTVDVDGRDVAPPTLKATATAGFSVPPPSPPPSSASPPATSPPVPVPTATKSSSPPPPPSVPPPPQPTGTPPAPVGTTPSTSPPSTAVPTAPASTAIPPQPPAPPSSGVRPVAHPAPPPGRPGLKTPLFLLVMMMPAAAVAAVLAARRT